MKIELTLDEVNMVILALEERPFKQVVNVHNKIRTQAQAQLDAMNSPVEKVEMAITPKKK